MALKEQIIRDRQKHALKRGQSQPQRQRVQGSFEQKRVASHGKHVQLHPKCVRFVSDAEVAAITERLLKEKAELWRKLSTD